LLFHVANQYEAYKDDAKNAAKVLGLDAKSVQTIGKQSFDMVSFPEFQLDGYLPNLSETISELPSVMSFVTQGRKKRQRNQT
jgi:DNA mismatch repair ATPase MutS